MNVATVVKVDRKTKATESKAKAKPKAEPKAKSTKTRPAPTHATPAVFPNTSRPVRTERHSREVWAKKGKAKAEATTAEPIAPGQSERKPEQPSTIARVEGTLTGKLSAIDAAAKVLETSGPLNCKELVEAMSTQ